MPGVPVTKAKALIGAYVYYKVILELCLESYVMMWLPDKESGIGISACVHTLGRIGNLLRYLGVGGQKTPWGPGKK
jgi:hypothetical protein